MQKWRPWEAASDTEWGLALEREAVIRPLTEQERLSTAALAVYAISCDSAARQASVKCRDCSSDWLIAQQWLPSDRPMSPLILSGV